jgi:hypothetical protein
LIFQYSHLTLLIFRYILISAASNVTPVTQGDNEMTAEQLAANVADFITHNGIDISKVSMDEIVAGYFAAQMQAIEEAAKAVAIAIEADLL